MLHLLVRRERGADGDSSHRASDQRPPNLEIIRGLYELFNVGGADAVRELLDPDVVFKEPPEQPGATTFQGLEAVIKGFGKWSENWVSHRIEPERLVDL